MKHRFFITKELKFELYTLAAYKGMSPTTYYSTLENPMASKGKYLMAMHECLAPQMTIPEPDLRCKLAEGAFKAYYTFKPEIGD